MEDATRASSLRLLRDCARLEQVGQIGCVRCVSQKWSYMEDFLHGAQVGGMRVIRRTGIRKAVHILVCARRDENLADGVTKVVRVVTCNAVLFGFVPPK